MQIGRIRVESGSPRGARAGRASGAVGRVGTGAAAGGRLDRDESGRQGGGGLDLLSIRCENARQDGEHETVVE